MKRRWGPCNRRDFPQEAWWLVAMRRPWPGLNIVGLIPARIPICPWPGPRCRWSRMGRLQSCFGGGARPGMSASGNREAIRGFWMNSWRPARADCCLPIPACSRFWGMPGKGIFPVGPPGISRRLFWPELRPAQDSRTLPSWRSVWGRRDPGAAAGSQPWDIRSWSRHVAPPFWNHGPEAGPRAPCWPGLSGWESSPELSGPIPV